MVGSHGAAGEETSPGVQIGAQDEARLLHRIAAGELRAFEDLYRLYHPRLARFVAKLVHKPELIEEVVNDALLAVWRRPGGYSGASKVSTWIFAIAYRKALKARRRFDEPMEDNGAEAREGEEARPDQQLGQLQAHEALLVAMDQLSADHRTVVDLTYFHDFGYREIAEIMACPVDTVKTRMFHARRSLKRALSGNLADWL